MKKILYITMCAAGLFSITSCSDYLETNSPSTVDADFVFSNMTTAHAAMDGAYESWRDVLQNGVFGDGLWYAADVAGSDIMRHPEAFSNQPGRHYPETFYQNGTYAGSYGLLSYLKEDDIYAKLFKCVSLSNAIISGIEDMSDFEERVGNVSEPNTLSQLYGEAVALKACAYRELIKNWGDVPFQTRFGQAANGLTSRDSIYDVILADLIKVEPKMFVVGSNPDYAKDVKNYFSRTFVQGLIGRIALEAGGYQTRRGDITPVDGSGNAITIEKKGTENNGATYGRRSDWKNYFEMAKTYFKKAIDNSGTATFSADYETFFLQMMGADAVYADESIYEAPMQQGGGNDARSYSFGRPSNGGSKNAYPCKAYGQGRINPAFYYGMFDPKDVRRDISCCVTGSSGKGVEVLIPFKPNSKASGGGISTNKWDENRQSNPWVGAQRKSGINQPYMRLSEIYLGYAEACAATGNDAEARNYLNKIRNRAFPNGGANTDAFIAKSGSLYNAIIDERGFEFAGEGDRRFTLIRSGLVAEKIKAIKELTNKMMNGLKSQGYFVFDNGNVISNYVWTKLVDAKSIYGYRLTGSTPAGKEDDPVLAPGWRGQNDNWEAFGLNYGTDTPATNLAIMGLFKHLSDSETAALEADGYKKENWGIDLVNNEDEYSKYLFYDYDYTKAPIYLWPFTPNVMATGGFTNGYGFAQE